MALHATPEQHAANPPESWRKGVSQTRLEGLRAAMSGEVPEVVQNAAFEMFDILNSGDLLDPYLLDEGEARELYLSLAEAWGFGSPVHDRIYRIKYGGFDGDKTALEVLEEMEQEEREEARWTADLIQISH